jgi:hypothetical protein
MEYCSWGILSTSSWNSPAFLRCNSPPDVLRHEPLHHTNFHTNSRILCTAVCNIPDIMEVLSNMVIKQQPCVIAFQKSSMDSINIRKKTATL